MHLRNLYNIRDYLDVKTRTLLVTNLVVSTIDYCNVLLIGCNQTDLKPLKLILNRSVRYILDVNFRQHITPFYKKLNFFPIQKRIQFKTCLLAYKIFFRIAPKYLYDDFPHYEPIQQMRLREGAGRDIFMFQNDKNDINNKTFYSKLRSQWNNLPLSIRKCESLTSFKTRLKTELFAQF